MAAEPLFTGQVLSGRYRLQHLLGQGGMGRVWQASHLSLGTDIAIKFLDPRLSSCDDIRSRFAREATAAASIKSPHVVSVMDSGFTDQGLAYIAMELLRGEDLGRRLARENTLSPALTSSIISQVCRGLGKAHAMDIIHRDVKPENLFLSDDEAEPWVKVLDFGIAKSIGDNRATYKTDTGLILGTPLYMSPEQALGRTLDVRSDLYSLAVVAYRCLAGRPPFQCGATGELIVAVSTRVPPTASSFNPTLRPALDAWFSSMLLKDPNERCAQTARELADTFAAACEGVAPPTRVSLAPTLQSANAPTLPDHPVRGDEAPANPTDAAMSAALASRPGRHMRTRILITVSTLTVMLAALGSARLLWWRPAPPEVTRPAPSEAVTPLRPAPTAVPTSSVRISVSPPEARLWLDEEPLDNNPFVGSRPLDALPHPLRAEAAGYETERRSLRFDADVDLTLALRPSERRPEGRAPSGAATAAPIIAQRRASGASKGAPRRATGPAPAKAGAGPAPPLAPSPRKKSLELDRSDPWKTD
jgi:serine/threonine protein kinase